MVIEVNPNWKKIIKNPKTWVDDIQDTVLMKIVSVTEPNNPLLLMIGQDVFTGGYYIVVEDNDVSEDVYPSQRESVYDTFMRIYRRHVKADELLNRLYEASQNENRTLILTDENGERITPNPETINVINDILEKCVLPALVEIIVDKYKKKKVSVPKEMYVNLLIEYLNSIILSDEISFVYCDENKNEIELNEDGTKIMKLILERAYIPFIAYEAVKYGYRP